MENVNDLQRPATNYQQKRPGKKNEFAQNQFVLNQPKADYLRPVTAEKPNQKILYATDFNKAKDINSGAYHLENSRVMTTNSLRPSAYNLLNNIYASHTKPKKLEIYQDKEKLFDDTIKLNQNLVGLISENNKLKSVSENLENELDQKNIIIENLIESIQSTDLTKNRNKNSHLAVELKRQIKLSNAESREKDEKLESLIRNNKYTKILELETQIYILKEENLRLNNKIEELANRKGDMFGSPVKEIEIKINEMGKEERNLKNQLTKIQKANEDKEDEISFYAKKEKELQDKIKKNATSANDIKAYKNENLELRQKFHELKKLPHVSIKISGSKNNNSIKNPNININVPKNSNNIELALEMKKLQQKQNQEIKDLLSANMKELKEIEPNIGTKMISQIPIPQRKELKYNLLLSKIKFDEILKELELIGGSVLKFSILEKAFAKPPFNLKKKTIESIINHLKNLTGNQELISSLEATHAFLEIIGNYDTFDENIITLDIIKKLSEIKSKILVDNNNFDENYLIKFLSQNLISNDKKLSEYIEFSIFKLSKNLEDLNSNFFVKFIENYLNECNKSEITHHHEKIDSDNLHSYKPSLEENNKKGNEIQSQSSKEQLEKQNENPNNELEHSDDEKLLEMAKEVFDSISKLFIDKKIQVSKYYEKDITKSDGCDLIETNKFLEGLKDLGLKELTESEIICIIKVLAADEEGKYIKISDLAQILSDYGLNDSKLNELKGPDFFNELDNVSLVILLALTEYLLQGKIPLYNLFEGLIKEIKDEEGNTYEVITSSDFFNVLEKIGIKMEEKEYKNLKDFLSISAENNEFLAISSIKNAIEEIASNPELNEKARRCYEEIQGEVGESSEILGENLKEKKHDNFDQKKHKENDDSENKLENVNNLKDKIFEHHSKSDQHDEENLTY